MISRILSLAVLLSIVPAPASEAAAQTDTMPVAASVLRYYCPGGEVRLSSAATVVQGYCGRIEDGRLLVRFGRAGSEQQVSLAGVDSVWVHERATLRGATIGSAIGGGLMAGLGFVFVQALCEGGDCAGETVYATIAGLFVGGAGGGLIGAALGYGTWVWDRKLPQR